MFFLLKGGKGKGEGSEEPRFFEIFFGWGTSGGKKKISKKQLPLPAEGGMFAPFFCEAKNKKKLFK